MPIVETACPRNCYSTCALRAEVEDGRIRRILPHAGNLATAQGPCLKGLSYVERQVTADRVLRPLERQGGSFAPISWDDALDRLSERLDRLRRGPGPRAAFYYASSGTKGLLNSVGATFWRLFGGYTTTYGDLCWPAGLEATRLTLGANQHNAPWDLENAQLIVMWGKNAAETNIHQMVFVERALARGAKLVVIDPRRTQTAERADQWIQPRPGTDGALALAVAHRLFATGGVDGTFLSRHALGVQAYHELAITMPPARAAKICGVPETQIIALADTFAERKPATVAAGYGMQRYTNSGQAMRAILALVVLTGNLGKPGAGWQFANLQTAIFDEVIDPLAFYPPAEDDGIARVAVSTARLGRDMARLQDPPLRFAWVERGNPLTQNPDTRAVEAAFAALDYRVVVDQFLTDTARAADLVLPAKTMFEQTDVIGAYWHPYLQLRRKALDPPGEVKTETEIYRLLTERLGLQATAPLAELFPVSDAEVDAWLGLRLARVGLTLADFDDGPLLAPGHEEVAFSDLRFPTPSGKIELASREAVERWGVEELPGWQAPEESALQESPPYPLQFLTPNTKNRIHSQFNNLRMIRQRSARPYVEIHPNDAAARGILHGDRVRIWNDRGELFVDASLNAGIRPGCVAVTNGWWTSDGGNVNACSPGRETDMGFGAAFHDNLVEVEGVSSEPPLQ